MWDIQTYNTVMWDIQTYNTVSVQHRHKLPEENSGCSAHVAVGLVLITLP